MSRLPGPQRGSRRRQHLQGGSVPGVVPNIRHRQRQKRHAQFGAVPARRLGNREDPWQLRLQRFLRGVVAVAGLAIMSWGRLMRPLPKMLDHRLSH